MKILFTVPHLTKLAKLYSPVWKVLKRSQGKMVVENISLCPAGRGLDDALPYKTFILTMSAVKIHHPHAKALPFNGAIWVQVSAFLPWCVTISLKEETIARQRARPPCTARYPYMVFLYVLGMGTWNSAPTQPMPSAHWASLYSTLTLAQPSLQTAHCSWQNSWQNGWFSTSPPLSSLGEGRKSEVGSHHLSYCSTTQHCCGVPGTQLPEAISPWHASTHFGSKSRGGIKQYSRKI